MIVATTSAVGATQDLGAALAELARPGDVVLLSGELGAGKTAFVQGFGRGLGITEHIVSPTFMLAREHSGGRLLLYQRKTALEETGYFFFLARLGFQTDK